MEKRRRLLMQLLKWPKQALNVTCIAEGVETVEQLNYLKGKGCERFQGYYFSRPEPEAYWAELKQNPTLP